MDERERKTWARRRTQGGTLLKGDKKGSLDPKVPNLIRFYTAEFLRFLSRRRIHSFDPLLFAPTANTAIFPSRNPINEN